jgi:putative endopeptidase
MRPMPPSPGGRALPALLLAALAPLAAGCWESGPGPRRDSAPEPDPSTLPDGGTDSNTLLIRPAFEASFMDRNASPCEDFYRFACGGWVAQNPLGTASVRTRFSEVSAALSTFLVDTITLAHVNRAATPDPEMAAIGHYFQACVEAPARGTSRDVIKSLVANIDRVDSVAGLAVANAEIRKLGISGLFLQYSAIDPFEPTRRIWTVDQGARTLHPAYYSGPYLEVRTAYASYITRLAGLLGVAIDPAAVLRVETALAAAETPRPFRPDPRTVEHRISFTELQALTPRFPWRMALDALGHGAIEQVNARSMEFLQKLEQLLGSVPLDDWKHYLRWRLANGKAALLDQAVLDAQFDFYGKVLEGRTAPVSRQAVCYQATADAFANELSRQYVEKRASPELRAAGVELTMAIRDSFLRRMMDLPWLDEPTRTAAQAKLRAIVAQVAFPDGLPRITSAQPVKNFFDLEMDTARAVAQAVVRSVGEPVERQKIWIASPTEINAFYAPILNAIYIPAVMLSPPMFDRFRNPLGNYAFIGSIIGHELTHGFDNNGRLHDERGAVRSWWTPLTDQEFESRGMCVASFYGMIEPLPGRRLDGRRTLGENIADLGGLRLAYDTAMRLHGDVPAVSGYDARQQFFLSYAQLFCSNQSTASLTSQIAGEAHSPHPQRVFGSLAHLPEFAQAWSCPAGSRMRPEPTCTVW